MNAVTKLNKQFKKWMKKYYPNIDFDDLTDREATEFFCIFLSEEKN